MRICFVGADLEENLGIGILAAVAERRGQGAAIVPFNDVAETERVVRRALAGEPDVIGLSVQFQHRAPEFLALSRRLREAGFRGHLTCGGQFPTLAFREVLLPENGVDSVVLHDGEETLADLLEALERGAPLASVPGLALRADDGAAMRTEARRLLDDLDGVPFAKRYRPHNRHMGVPFIPIIGGRGCWGKCSYCSIVSFYDDAIDAGGGKAVRLRSPANIAAEMALLLDAAGGRGIFCFHDDNFIFPGERYSINRVRAIREALDAYGVGRVAMVGKARPDCVTPALARELADLGVIRLYVGVENGSEAGGDHLRRGTQQAHVRGALEACREAGIFVCYNLLVFEPEATIADVRDNVRFIVDHAEHPVNFCRAEPYFGTALHVDLSARQDLGGSYLGFNYRIADDRAELLFRICSAAFRERNFAPNGVANRYMGLGYAANVLRRFHDDAGSSAPIVRRARELTRRISLDTAEHLTRAIDLAERAPLGDFDAIERETARLGLAIAAADRRWHEELDALYADMRAFAEHPAASAAPAPRPTASFQHLKSSLALGVSMAVALGGCDGCGNVETSGSGGQGGMVVDPPPPDGGTGGMGGSMVVDPPPPDAGTGGGGTMVVDPPPPDAGTGGFGGAGGYGGAGGAGGQGGHGGMVVDPPPPDGMPGTSALDVESGERFATIGREPRKLRLIDQWFDTSPKTSVRTVDLALFDPPRPRLSARREGDTIAVSIDGLTALVSTRWEAEGEVEGDGLEVRWRPSGPADRVRVAVRSRGGVAVLSLRADEARA
ncbi:MAG: B12-binding domain-containing radical SAM protein [Polyangiaceae bacterium]|nr:B12-binding domain-containing radical SAM protein [Polyangiaceae bacterium]